VEGRAPRRRATRAKGFWQTASVGLSRWPWDASPDAGAPLSERAVFDGVLRMLLSVREHSESEASRVRENARAFLPDSRASFSDDENENENGSENGNERFPAAARLAPSAAGAPSLRRLSDADPMRRIEAQLRELGYGGDFPSMPRRVELRARGALAPEQVRAEGAGVRTLYKRLQAGGTVGILPDQQPKQGDGEFAPFFGVPALTMVLLPRLAQRTGATVLFAFAERLPHGAGFRVRFRAAPDGIAAADLPTAVAALNRGVEECVQLAFEQYQWHYKRFQLRPDGGTNPYWRG